LTFPFEGNTQVQGMLPKHPLHQDLSTGKKTTMTITEADPPSEYVRFCRSFGGPSFENGEEEVAIMLEAAGYIIEYETRFFSFVYQYPGSDRVIWGGFMPDYFVPATDDYPAFCVEVTMADHLEDIPEARALTNQRALELKRLKIALTSEIYGIETILVTHAVLHKLRRNPHYLQQLVQKAIQRHRYREQHRLQVLQPAPAA
jgi:hypothetical protein